MGTSTFWFKSDKSVGLLILDYISLHLKDRFSSSKHSEGYNNTDTQTQIGKKLITLNLTLITFI